jgi:hypothetical protein
MGKKKKTGIPSTCIFSSAMFLDDGAIGWPPASWRDLSRGMGEM